MEVPIWDGDAETLDAYQKEVELLLLGIAEGGRTDLGPRLVLALPRRSTLRKVAARLSRDPEDESGIV